MGKSTDGFSTLAKTGAKTPSAGQAQTFDLGSGVTLDLVWIPAGTFMMGSPESEKDRDPSETQHRVTISNGFWMGKYEVTQEQYAIIMGSNPSCFKKEVVKSSGFLGLGPKKILNEALDNPVENLRWFDCRLFVEKLNTQIPSGGFRLPTEEEWEYACRAGTQTPYAGNLDEMGWYSNNSNDEPQPVGRKMPNGWGLYDMHGNVREWCQTHSVLETVRGSYPGERDATRGGSCLCHEWECRSAEQCWLNRNGKKKDLGFRVVRDPVSKLH